eukprot:706349-Ditylum_brightwellii.AAC.1
MSLDIVNMYPSTRLPLIKWALCHYLQTLPKEEKQRIECCITMIAIEIKTMPIQFQDQYYNYKGVVNEDGDETNEDNNGLAIGAFELAFCTDISATYTYEICKEILTKLKYASSYRDDGLAIFEGKKTCCQTILWLHEFQLHLSEVVGGNFLQFTVELCAPSDGGSNDPSA